MGSNKVLAGSLLVLLLCAQWPAVSRAEDVDTNADLTTISQGAGLLTPVFNATTYTGYQVVIPSSQPAQYYTAAKKANLLSTLEYSMNLGSWIILPDWTSTGYIGINRGHNAFKFRVTVLDPLDILQLSILNQKTYDIDVYYPNPDDNLLKSLQLGEGISFDKPFSSSEHTYTANVPNSTTSVHLTGALDDPAASLQVNSTSVTNAVQSGEIPLQVGENLIPIDVLPFDVGAAAGHYVLKVVRAASSIFDLGHLSVGGVSLDQQLTGGQDTFTLADVSNATNSLDILPAVADVTAQVQMLVNDAEEFTEVASGEASSVPLNVGLNTIKLKVIAEDGSEKLYTILVNRLASSLFDLGHLTVGGVSLDPQLSGGQDTFTLADVSNATSSLDILPSVADVTAQVQMLVNDAAEYTEVASGEASSVPLNVGLNTIKLKVIAEDGSEKLYTILVNRLASSFFDLGHLSVGGVSLDQQLSGGQDTFTLADVSNATSSLDILPAVADVRAQVQMLVNDAAEYTEVVSGEASSVPLNVGLNTIKLKVIAEDGSEKLYTILVNRLASSLFDLGHLTVGGESLDELLSGGQDTFSLADVSNATSSLDILPAVADVTAQVQMLVNDAAEYTEVVSGEASSVPLNVGLNTIKLKVIAEDGSEKLYTILVNRLASSLFNLGHLSVGGESLDELLSGGQDTFTLADVSNATSSLDILPAVADVTAQVQMLVNDAAEYTEVVSGEASSVPLNVGLNTIKLKVIAEDGSEKLYTILVNRLASSLFDLGHLTVGGESLDELLSGGQDTFSLADVSNATSSLDILPAVADVTAQVQMLVNDAAEYTEVASGEATNVALNVGLNTIKLKVIAEDGNEKLYTILVNRLASSLFDLGHLSVGGVSLDELLSGGQDTFTLADVSNATSSLDILPAVADVTAQVQMLVNDAEEYTEVVSGEASSVPLNVGLNTIKLKVIAEDGSEKLYTILVTRLEAAADPDPEDPSTPTDPADPTDPTEPSDPSDPSDPIESSPAVQAMKEQLLELDTDQDGIHVEELLRWIQGTGVDLTGDGIFDAADVKLVLQQIKPMFMGR
ncbi:cadherin-like beta sandwich domain-containing protein [Paenibacillus hexagrammi]|uniref:Cadherin-like beta sandwich domain-containing protein n=1 Tax=Paenibacillus hexagrammi TaxID=2908839 RepID=A0ABY3SLC4_9BACL|nr:cadherin-like beta sandwich domain-containing protein [Paenibacillus sp. YPD9-1]UJF34200.1 cadherin-like beta sandwich domain-containing protein [Paenibacillus sp. YPD9-1]